LKIDLLTFSCSGNVVNGTIGKQMVDTLVESASNVEVRYFFNHPFKNHFSMQYFFSVDFEILRHVLETEGPD
jgi:hypothetical protein